MGKEIEMNAECTENGPFHVMKNGTISRHKNNSLIPNALVSDGQRISLADEEDPKNFIIPIYKKIKIRICKPLIPLRFALFMWYGAGSINTTFLIVLFKQRGITATEMSTVYLILPVMQFFGPMISGIIADKIGNSKPVLSVIVLLNAIIMIGILVTSDINVLNCNPQPINLVHHDQNYSQLIADEMHDVCRNDTELTSCNLTCVDDVIQPCFAKNLIYGIQERNGDRNISIFVYLNQVYKFKSKCYFNITSLSYRNIIYSDLIVKNTNCTMSCLIHRDNDCSEDTSRQVRVLILNASFLVLIFIVLSTTYRIFDVTAMAMVKEHNSDFGRERVFSMFGQFAFSSFYGYLAMTATDEERKNYKTCLYLFIVTIFVLLSVIYKLEVQIRPPGKNMWKKSLHLLKKPDVFSFAIVLLILGSSCGFRFTFLSWYLEELGTSSFLLGMIHGVKALYGLPFLFTSNWWLKKIGTTRVFLICLCGYTVQGIGYALIYDPLMSFLLEATEIFTYHLLWVAAVVHSHNIAPEGLTSTVISVAGAVHYSLGKGAGAFIGGYIMDSFGGRMAFIAMSVTCSTAAIFYALYIYWRFKHSSKKLSFDPMECNGRKPEN